MCEHNLFIIAFFHILGFNASEKHVETKKCDTHQNAFSSAQQTSQGAP